MTFDPERAAAIIAAHDHLEGPLLPILHALRDAFGWIEPGLIPLVAAALNLTRAEVHGVVSFYHDFRTAPPGRHVVRLCRAEACQARGGRDVETAAGLHLGLAMNTTSIDGAVSLEAVYCLGLCASGPAAMIDGILAARLTPERLDALLDEALQ